MPRHEYRKNRLKVKHAIIKEAMPYLEEILTLPFVQLIVPDVIDNHSHGRNRMRLSSQAVNGFKLTFGGAGAQKYHVVCEPLEEHRRAIEAAIARIAGR
ncbi:MAG: hypothetical protein HZA03_08870 [Nitrospinae bacterium]|nr:hypothetical protein [Nitrospinota bacterium]